MQVKRSIPYIIYTNITTTYLSWWWVLKDFGDWQPLCKWDPPTCGREWKILPRQHRTSHLLPGNRFNSIQQKLKWPMLKRYVSCWMWNCYYLARCCLHWTQLVWWNPNILYLVSWFCHWNVMIQLYMYFYNGFNDFNIDQWHHTSLKQGLHVLYMLLIYLCGLYLTRM